MSISPAADSHVHDSDSHGHHDPAVAHQFEDKIQQKEVAQLGIWAFLITEVMFFAGLFLAFTVYRYWYGPTFEEASSHLSWKIGGINMLVLLTSSYTMALAVLAGHKGDNRKVVLWLSVTLLLALAFLGIKTVEYADKYHHGLIPGINYSYTGSNPQQAVIFFVLYFVMTGLHGLHVVGGVVVIAWVIGMAMKKKFSRDYNNPVEVTGLYWHFVDLVWIFLYPLLYLLGTHFHGLTRGVGH